MTTEPKFKKPVKVGNNWPGKTQINFSHPGIQYPWKYHCPQPLCFYHIVAATEDLIDKRIEDHAENTCPWFGGGTTTFSWGVMSDEYLRPIWAKLDAEVDVIKGTCGFPPEMPDDDIRQMMQDARLRARGLAEALAVLMPPFFTTGDEVVKEAIVRWEKRQAGEDYETPGLGRFKFQRPPGVVGDPNNPSWVTKPEYDIKDRSAVKPVRKATESKVAVQHKLTDEEIAKIKASSAFPVRMLAQAYNTTEAVIKQILAK